MCLGSTASALFVIQELHKFEEVVIEIGNLIADFFEVALERDGEAGEGVGMIG